MSCFIGFCWLCHFHFHISSCQRFLLLPRSQTNQVASHPVSWHFPPATTGPKRWDTLPLGGWAPSGCKWLGSSPIYKPWSSAIWKGSHNPILRGLTITMVINHLRVLGWSSKHSPKVEGMEPKIIIWKNDYVLDVSMWFKKKNRGYVTKHFLLSKRSVSKEVLRSPMNCAAVLRSTFKPYGWHQAHEQSWLVKVPGSENVNGFWK